MKGVVIVLVAITLSSSAQVITPSAVSSILQDILSPANTDRAMQLKRMAAARPNQYATPQIARAVACDELPPRVEYLPPREMPMRVPSEGYGRPVPDMGVQKMLRQVPARELRRGFQPNLMDSLVLPKEVMPVHLPPSEIPMRLANEGYGRAGPEMCVQEMLRQVPMREVRREFQPSLMDSLVLPKEVMHEIPMCLSNEGYARAVCDMGAQKMLRQVPMREVRRDFQPSLMDSLVLPKEVIHEMPMRVSSEGYTRVVPDMGVQEILIQVPMREVRRGYQPSSMDSLVLSKEVIPVQQEINSCLAPLAFNPYLPVASPVSAMSPGVMPAPTQSRGQFLRKIPIHPPTV